MFDKTHRKAAARRAQRGALWLDKVQPGWHNRVYLPWLRMDSAHRCVLAKVTGTGFTMARLSLGMDRASAKHHGFYTIHPWFYRFLDEAWKREVLVRRRADQKAALDECKRIVDGWVQYDRTTITN